MRAAGYALAAMMPIAIILLSFLIALNAWPEKITDSDMTERAEIISYIQGGEEYHSELTGNERAHLEDVKKLISISYCLFYAAILLTAVLSYFPYKSKDLKRSLNLGAVSCIAITLIVSALISINFQSAFITFHKILFTNDLWLLPADSTLITIFPEKFFIKFAERVGLYITAISLLIIIGKRYIR